MSQRRRLQMLGVLYTVIALVGADRLYSYFREANMPAEECALWLVAIAWGILAARGVVRYVTAWWRRTRAPIAECRRGDIEP